MEMKEKKMDWRKLSSEFTPQFYQTTTKWRRTTGMGNPLTQRASEALYPTSSEVKELRYLCPRSALNKNC
jgi:hypothetical protein